MSTTASGECLLGDGGEVPDIGEEDGHLAPGGVGHGVLPRSDDLADEFARHVDREGLYRVARRGERAGQHVDLADPGMGEPPALEVEIADLVGVGGERVERAADAARDQAAR